MSKQSKVPRWLACVNDDSNLYLNRKDYRLAISASQFKLHVTNPPLLLEILDNRHLRVCDPIPSYVPKSLFKKEFEIPAQANQAFVNLVRQNLIPPMDPIHQVYQWGRLHVVKKGTPVTFNPLSEYEDPTVVEGRQIGTVQRKKRVRREPGDPRVWVHLRDYPSWPAHVLQEGIYWTQFREDVEVEIEYFGVDDEEERVAMVTCDAMDDFLDGLDEFGDNPEIQGAKLEALAFTQWKSAKKQKIEPDHKYAQEYSVPAHIMMAIRTLGSDATGSEVREWIKTHKRVDLDPTPYLAQLVKSGQLTSIEASRNVYLYSIGAVTSPIDYRCWVKIKFTPHWPSLITGYDGDWTKLSCDKKLNVVYFSTGERGVVKREALTPFNEGLALYGNVSRIQKAKREAIAYDEAPSTKEEKEEVVEEVPVVEDVDYVELEFMAQKGDADAMMKMGDKFDAEGNSGVATMWYTRAALKSHPVGMYTLGYSFYHGTDVKQSFKNAFTWFMKAAQAGNDDAYYWLYKCCKNGEGCEVDDDRAAYWLDKGVAANHGLCKAEKASITTPVKQASSKPAPHTPSHTGNKEAYHFILNRSLRPPVPNELVAGQCCVFLLADDETCTNMSDCGLTAIEPRDLKIVGNDSITLIHQVGLKYMLCAPTICGQCRFKLELSEVYGRPHWIKDYSVLIKPGPVEPSKCDVHFTNNKVSMGTLSSLECTFRDIYGNRINSSINVKEIEITKMDGLKMRINPPFRILVDGLVNNWVATLTLANGARLVGVPVLSPTVVAGHPAPRHCSHYSNSQYLVISLRDRDNKPCGSTNGIKLSLVNGSGSVIDCTEKLTQFDAGLFRFAPFESVWPSKSRVLHFLLEFLEGHGLHGSKSIEFERDFTQTTGREVACMYRQIAERCNDGQIEIAKASESISRVIEDNHADSVIGPLITSIVDMVKPLMK